jgi:hypothetical protein
MLLIGGVSYLVGAIWITAGLLRRSTAERCKENSRESARSAQPPVKETHRIPARSRRARKMVVNVDRGYRSLRSLNPQLISQHRSAVQPAGGLEL